MSSLLGRIFSSTAQVSKPSKCCEPGRVDVSPESGVTEEELLHVAASALHFSGQPLGLALELRAKSAGVPLTEPDDLRRLPGGGIHCWIDCLPTVIGPRAVLTRLGICSQKEQNLPDDEILVAQGSRVLGAILMSNR